RRTVSTSCSRSRRCRAPSSRSRSSCSAATSSRAWPTRCAPGRRASASRRSTSCSTCSPGSGGSDGGAPRDRPRCAGSRHALRRVRRPGRARAQRGPGRRAGVGQPRDGAGHRVVRPRASERPGAAGGGRRGGLRACRAARRGRPRGRRRASRARRRSAPPAPPADRRRRALDSRARGWDVASATVVPAALRDPWVLLALTTPVQFSVGWQFHRGFLHDLRYRNASMATLVSVGTNAAYFFSVAVTLWLHAFPQHGAMTYFDVSAVVITLVVLGRWLEARAPGRTSEAIRRLLTLAPRTPPA